jgi:tetratricopeptide (TPR) repeat protein
VRSLFIIVALISIVLASCSKEQAKSPAPETTKKSDFEIVREQVTKDPKDADAWYHLAELYERAEAYQEEIDALNHVISLRPDQGYTYFKLGTTYNRIERYQDAVTNYLKAAKYLHNQPMIYNNLAISYGKLGKTDDEIAALKKALAIRPKYTIARFNLGMAYLKQGNRAEAMKQYQAIKNVDVGFAVALKKEIDSKGK